MRLLVAVDLNDAANEVLAAARTWAERLSAVLDVLYVDDHAYNVYLVQDPAIRSVLEGEWGKIREQQQSRLQELLDAIPLPIRGQALIVTGRPSDEICEAAKARDAVVLATHGRRGLSHVLMGSVAERVVRHCPVPVLVVRLPTPAA